MPTIAAEAERLGYAELWLAEDYFELGGIAAVSAALAATEALPVGLGVLANRVRHPAVTAMELATLAGIYPGRFMAGLGHGVPDWMGQMGLRPASLLRSLREGASAVRRLLDGEQLIEVGEYSAFDEVRLLHPPTTRLPLYFGVHGPRSLELSGELADGTLLGWFSSPEYVRWARARIDEGRTRVGRTDEHAVVAKVGFASGVLLVSLLAILPGARPLDLTALLLLAVATVVAVRRIQKRSQFYQIIGLLMLSSLVLLVLAAAVFTGGVLAEDSLEIQTDPIRWVNQDTQVIEDITTLEDEIGGSSEVGVYVVADGGESLVAHAWRTWIGRTLVCL